LAMEPAAISVALFRLTHYQAGHRTDLPALASKGNQSPT